MRSSSRIPVSFGRAGLWEWAAPEGLLTVRHRAPPPLSDVAEATRLAIRNPAEGPPLEHSIVPGDRVAIALDRGTPAAEQVMAGLWSTLAARGVQAADVTIVQPASLRPTPLADPRTALPADARAAMHWIIHDPTATNACRYLANSAQGERLYLNTHLTDSDIIIPVGPVMFDDLLGYRGTSSVLYPGLASLDSLRKAVGQGHDELGPDSSFPLRQVAEETAWLLGIQFAVQVVPASQGGAGEILAGQCETVFRRAKEFLCSHWRVQIKNRCQTVILTLDAAEQGQGWNQLAAALTSARRIVTQGGRIVVLSDLGSSPAGGNGDELSTGLRILQSASSPREAIGLLKEIPDFESCAARPIARALDWAEIHLHSALPSQLVESLGMNPLLSLDEVTRLVDQSEACVLLESAQHCDCCIADRPKSKRKK